MDLTGQIVLAYLEEDDARRVLFRVRPLLSAQGAFTQEDLEEYELDGFLRVAPDRQEQHSFKERMSSLGALCLINLSQAQPVMGKVRPNKNYAPGRGEDNRFIIYSDAVQELPPGMVFEVVSEEHRAGALTQQYYLRAGGRISGPYCPDGSLACPTARVLMPDSEQLFLVEMPDGNSRMFYWPQASQTSSGEEDADTRPSAAARPEKAPAPQPAAALLQAARSIHGALSDAGFALELRQAAHTLVLLLLNARVQLEGDTPADSAFAARVLGEQIKGIEEESAVRLLHGQVRAMGERRRKRFLASPWPVVRLESGEGLPLVKAGGNHIDLPALREACKDMMSGESIPQRARLDSLLEYCKDHGRVLPLAVRFFLARGLLLGSLLPAELQAGLFDFLVLSCASPYEQAQGFGKSVCEEFLAL